MNNYKTNSAFNKWFSSINLEKLSNLSKQKIADYNLYRKKLSFEAVLKLFLYGTNEEKESLRDLSTSLIIKQLQKETKVETMSHSQLSRSLSALDTDVLVEIFQQLTLEVSQKTAPSKRNCLQLIDSSTF